MLIGSRTTRAPRPPRGISWGYCSRRAATLATSVALAAAILAPTATVAGAYDPATDVDSMYTTALYTGAQAWCPSDDSSLGNSWSDDGSFGNSWSDDGSLGNSWS